MDVGHFYFLLDKYFAKCGDAYLMPNKSSGHKRPYYCAFADKKAGLYWLVPISSQVDKYREIFKTKNNCITLEFGEVLGKETAFLIQNMCPATDAFVSNEYLDKNDHKPICIDGVKQKKVIKNARKALALQRQGKKILFADVQTIETMMSGTDKK